MPTVKPLRAGAVVATLALALGVLGCSTKAPPGAPVQLLTGVMPFDRDECSEYGAGTILLIDEQYGTVLATEWEGARIPVMWPPGYTGRQVGPDMYYACGQARPWPTSTPLPMI